MRRLSLLVSFTSVLVAAPASLAAPVITEVAWMGSPTNANDEWVEIYNPGPDPIADLSQFTLVEGTTQHTLPAVSLAAGAVLVLEDSAGATSLNAPQAEVLALSLNNGGELLRLCPVATPGDLATCDIANNGGAWAAGSNTTKATMVRKDAALDGSLASSWVTYSGPDSVVTDSGAAAFKGSPGEYTAEEEPDAGPPVEDGGPDAGPDPVDAGPLPPPPAITEVAWMGSLSNANDEWVELYNAGPAAIASLASYVLVDNGGAQALPNVPLAAGAVVVIERSAAATSLAPPEAEVKAMTLTNSGPSEYLRICPATDPNDLGGCDVALVQGANWPAGNNTSKRTMVRVDVALDGIQPSSWATHSGPASLVTDSGGQGILGTPGVYEPLAIGPQPDGGVIIVDDGGVIVQPDAGPNDPPTLTLGQLSQDGAGGVQVSYTASDPDGDATVSVALFYDTDEAGYDGVRIAEGLAGGDRTFLWTTRTVAPGRYHVFGVATDHRGAVSYAYASGSVVLDGAGGGNEATIRVTDPDGVNDVVNGRITVRWEVDVPGGEPGTVSLFYDDDDSGLDGEPIIAGLPITSATGEEGPRAYLWDPAGVPPGAYTIYAVVDWTGGTAADYSEYVSVGGGGCSCRQADDEAFSSTILLGLILLVGARRASKRQKRRSC